MLFRKKIDRSCDYCQNGAKLDNGTVLCTKRGLILTDKPCRKFTYDPCKRIPPKQKAMNFHDFEKEDFSL